MTYQRKFEFPMTVDEAIVAQKEGWELCVENVTFRGDKVYNICRISDGIVQEQKILDGPWHNVRYPWRLRYFLQNP